MRIAFFGSSLVSSYWNGAATYYRGLVRALAHRGHQVTFFEPDAFDRQLHRDIADPSWAEVVVWDPTEARARDLVGSAACYDVVVKASGVGVLDAELERLVEGLAGPIRIFWDVDAPATLARVYARPGDPFRSLVPGFDLVLTYGGGEPVVTRYLALGANACIPVYNALDPQDHHPVPPDSRYESDLALLANRLPDRESRIERFFVHAALTAPDRTFLLGGSGWDDKVLPPNVRTCGHVGTADHNAFNSTPLTVLNVTRDSMAENGWSPATRVFEATGAGACLITDAWNGIEDFLAPGSEVLVAHDGEEVARHLAGMTPAKALAMGRAALARVEGEHTYEHRAEQVELLLRSEVAP
jgi:spore maturation protein CgeB